MNLGMQVKLIPSNVEHLSPDEMESSGGVKEATTRREGRMSGRLRVGRRMKRPMTDRRKVDEKTADIDNSIDDRGQDFLNAVTIDSYVALRQSMQTYISQGQRIIAQTCTGDGHLLQTDHGDDWRKTGKLILMRYRKPHGLM